MCQAAVLIGPQGSGKSTQMEFLHRAGFQPVVMSKVFGWATQPQEDDSPDDRKFRKELSETMNLYMSRGQHLPFSFVKKSLGMYLATLPGEKFAFDGIPRDEHQAEDLHEYLASRGLCTRYIILDLTLEEAVAGVARRVQQMLQASQKPRPDDLDPDVVATRLGIYFDRLDPMKAYFERVCATVTTVDARQSIEGVRNAIAQVAGIVPVHEFAAVA